jgi:diaminopimelate decarboxylase
MAGSRTLRAARLGRTPPTRSFWGRLVRPLLGRQPTPFYLFSPVPVEAALAELGRHFGPLPVRHWLSFKTQPLRPLVRWWIERGRGVEVVSEFEYRAALAEGCPPQRLLVNGPAKHRWLPQRARRELLVNLDSVHEAAALAPVARALDWTLGLRLNTREEFDPEAPPHPTQFGLSREEVPAVLQVLARQGLSPQIVHFHLRTNVASPDVYDRALRETAAWCEAFRLAPRVVDCGGGFPPPHVLTPSGRRLDTRFRLPAMARVLDRALRRFPTAREIWLENGRWLTARSGVLVVRILDVKQRRGMRHLLCDGGRTLHALVANWETHELLPLPRRAGATTLTTVTGPTCMAFDRLARGPLPRGLRPGDHLLWLDAGAYHLAWETRFSHGLAAVLWHTGRRVEVARRAEGFRHWWGQWRKGVRPAPGRANRR